MTINRHGRQIAIRLNDTGTHIVRERHLLNSRASRIPQICRLFDFSSHSSYSLRNRINFNRFCIASGLFGGCWMTCVAIVMPFIDDGLRLCPFRCKITVVCCCGCCWCWCGCGYCWCCCCCDGGCATDFQPLGFDGDETTVVSNFKWRMPSDSFTLPLSSSLQLLHSNVWCFLSSFSYGCAIFTVGSKEFWKGWNSNGFGFSCSTFARYHFGSLLLDIGSLFFI